MRTWLGRDSNGTGAILRSLACWILGSAVAGTNLSSATSIATPADVLVPRDLVNPDGCTAPWTIPSDPLQRVTLGDFNIGSQADIDALSNCTTIYGNVVIQNDTLTTISFSGIEEIVGNLQVSNCSQLESIFAPALNGASFWNFTLSNLPLLTTLDIPMWTFEIRNLVWESLPLLTQLNVNDRLLDVAGDFSLINTVMNTTFFNISTGTTEQPYYGGTIRIRDNPRLNEIVLSDLYDGSANIEIASNGPLAEVLLNNLKNADNISISNVKSLEIPLLANNISFIAGDFIFRNNSNVESLSLPGLKLIGGYYSGHGSLLVDGNAALHTISLPNLTSVYHNIGLSGPLSNVSMPGIAILDGPDDSYQPFSGNFHLQSTASSFDCRYFDHMNDATRHPINKDTWNGPPGSYSYSCHAIVPGTTKDVALHWKAPFRLSKKGKIAIIVVVTVAGLCLVVGFFYWQSRRHQRQVARLQAEEIGVPLEPVADHLPVYTRLGKPGEVPPGYHPERAPSSHSASSRTQTNDEAVSLAETHHASTTSVVNSPHP